MSSETPKNKKKGWLVALTGAAAAGGGLLWWTHDVSVIVVGHQWETHITIENFAARSQETWCNEMPNDAYNVKRAMKVRSQKQIKEGETCSTQQVKQPDGSFKEKQECQPKFRSEPVYDSSCQYDINRWGFLRDVSMMGNDRNIQWGRVDLKCTGEIYGCEREGQRAVKRFLSLKDPETDQTYRCEAPETLWKTAQTNTKLTLAVSNITGGERCGSLSLK